MATATVPARRGGILRRPTSTTGFWSWFTTIDHKKIGMLYGYTAFTFFIIGGLEALVIRAPARPARSDPRERRPVQPDLHDARR